MHSRRRMDGGWLCMLKFLVVNAMTNPDALAENSPNEIF